MNRVASGVLVLGLAALLAVACGGESRTEESGESHFLAFCEATCAAGFDCVCGACTASCSSSDECAGHASGAVCVPPSCGQGEPVCEITCESNADCSPLGSAYRCEGGACRVGEPPAGNDGGAPPDGGDGCGDGCQRVKIYPEVPGQGCLDVYVEHFEVCACGEPGVGRKCAKFEPDGALYRVPAGVDFPGADVTDCSEEEEARVLHACEVADCAVPPPSSCSVEDTCAEFGCGGLVFDDDGCRRAECSSDEECVEDERCVTTSIPASSCDYSPDGTVCNCAGPTLDLEGKVCNPVSEVGPRGAWQKIQFIGFQSECSQDCARDWTLIPSGELELALGDTVESMFIYDQIQLGEEELEEIDRLMDGPEIRPGLRDGFDCGPVEDYELKLFVTLSGEEFEQSVTACVDIPGHALQALSEIVMQE